MPKKKKKNDNEKYNIDEEIIIGYNTKKQKDKPTKTKTPKKKINKKPIVKEVPQEKATSKKKKVQKKKKKKSKFKKVLKILLKLLIVLGIAAGIILFLFVSPVFNIKEISIVGAYEISESVYISMSGIEIGENIFGVDKQAVIAEIKKEPYVGTVEVKCIYPGKVEIVVEERQISYVAEQNGKYFCIDKNGYILEINLSTLDFLAIKGYTTNLENLDTGKRINEKDLEKFNDLIKIVDAIQNNDINAKLTSIDISDRNNYILEFTGENKNIMLGDTSNLSAKMAWINLFIREKKNETGTVYLNGNDVYFSPEKFTP